MTLDENGLIAEPELSGHSIFAATTTRSPSARSFFAKIANINLICLLAPFIVETLKKSLEHIRSFEDALQFGSKITPTVYYFGKALI